jgi:hypothetical protein
MKSIFVQELMTKKSRAYLQNLRSYRISAPHTPIIKRLNLRFGASLINKWPTGFLSTTTITKRSTQRLGQKVKRATSCLASTSIVKTLNQRFWATLINNGPTRFLRATQVTNPALRVTSPDNGPYMSNDDMNCCLVLMTLMIG